MRVLMITMKPRSFLWFDHQVHQMCKWESFIYLFYFMFGYLSPCNFFDLSFNIGTIYQLWEYVDWKHSCGSIAPAVSSLYSLLLWQLAACARGSHKTHLWTWSLHVMAITHLTKFTKLKKKEKKKEKLNCKVLINFYMGAIESIFIGNWCRTY